ncbi:unnamed protein product [Effrenium voratum]|uniref:Uncharacterized protein n=1 Tax=Effrenium voratum TaxID=2562239 RepID=A0AA36MT80_9DINO|nr:unnamed protein product [Effrenium voratum]
MPPKSQEARTQPDEVVIFEGTFSWWAAWCMMIWVLCFLASTVLMILSTRGSAFQIISEEISYVKEVRPPYGPEMQPVVDATMREINQMFAYHLPQTAAQQLCSTPWPERRWGFSPSPTSPPSFFLRTKAPKEWWT